MNWKELTQQALDELGGRKTCVPGSALRLRVSRKASEQGEDLGAYLRSIDTSFSKWVALALKDENVRVYPRPGTDVLIGVEGAVWPTKEQHGEGATFRDDVYKALTQISPRPFVYVPNLDRFTDEPGTAQDAIEMPRVTLTDLVEQRRRFATERASENERREMIEALDASASPLAEFQRIIGKLGLGRRWHEYKMDALHTILLTWAQSLDVPISPAWLNSDKPDQPDNARSVLADLLQHMSDEEIRGLTVPLRAVEALVRDRPHRARA